MTRYERFVLWLNRFYHKQNKITICVLYTFIMAILGVLIYGATHQQANSSISVKYTVPSYTVTFDPNGGELSTTGGGVSSKIVKLGDTYGDLPVPTRTGYSFVGWKGSNYLNGYKFNKSDYVESFYFKNDTLSITSVTKTIPEEVAGTEQAYLGIYLSLPKGKYMVAYENRTYTETIDYPYLSLIDRSVDPQEYIWGNKVSDGASGTCFTLDKDYSTLYFVVYANINSNGWTSGTITYKGLMIYKVSSENEYVAYEPYYIESDTIFGTPGDRTLTAEWGTLMGSTTNYSSWTASEGVSSYSCSGDTITITSKDNLLSQAYLRQDISLTDGTYKFCFDSCSYSGVKPYPVAIIYDYNGWIPVDGTYIRAYSDNYANVGYFTFTSTHSCSFIVYACVDLGQSSCTVSFKNLRLIKLP